MYINTYIHTYIHTYVHKYIPKVLRSQEFLEEASESQHVHWLKRNGMYVCMYVCIYVCMYVIKMKGRKTGWRTTSA